MRCHYMSDLHLESQGFDWRLPKGDILIVAGDLCHARCLDPARAGQVQHRSAHPCDALHRQARSNFAHVLLVAGNHDHYDGVFDETIGILRQHLPGVTVLDNEHVEIDGVPVLRHDALVGLRGSQRGVHEWRSPSLRRVLFRQEAHARCRRRERPREISARGCLASLRRVSVGLRSTSGIRERQDNIVISHHAPSLQGMNPQYAGNGMDGAYASDLEQPSRRWSECRSGSTAIRISNAPIVLARRLFGQTAVALTARVQPHDHFLLARLSMCERRQKSGLKGRSAGVASRQ